MSPSQLVEIALELPTVAALITAMVLFLRHLRRKDEDQMQVLQHLSEQFTQALHRQAQALEDLREAIRHER